MESFVDCSPAKHEALSPVSFLKRAAGIYGEKPSLINYGGHQVFTWSQTYQRCLKLASALVQHCHISPGDLVAAFAPNIPELYELHYAVPMAGAVISPLNTKLDSPTLSLLLQQLHPKIIFLHSQFLQLILQSLHQTSSQKGNSTPSIILIAAETDIETNFLHYNGLLSMGTEDFIARINKESDPISVNFTSGSTGLHKGVVYSHRATYLNSLATIFRSQISRSPVFLWTVDMFRCNGWCFIWAVAALGGRNVFLRTVTAKAIFDAIVLHEVTILCGSPAILKIISYADVKKPLPRRVDLIIAGAFPVLEILKKVSEVGFDVSYGYGMTEALGPAIIRPCKIPSFDNSSSSCHPYDQYRKIKYNSDDGVQDLLTLEMDVKDPKTMSTVPEDGETLGEIMLKGNTLMSGYLRNPKATKEAFVGDWYRTGDVAIRHPGGFIEMKDRAEDIIVREGGEAVSTVEVEAVLMSHPLVEEAAVVRLGLGEMVCGFLKLKNGCCVSVGEIVEFCGDYLPHFMVPNTILFGDLPVNSTGKELTPAVLEAPECNSQMLQGAEFLGNGELFAPEDIAYDSKSGLIYTGCVDGWIKKLRLNDSTVEKWVFTGGRPLGIAMGIDGDVIVADAEKGLLRVTKEGVIEELVEEADGLKFKLTDGVDVADDGVIYFTDASSKYGFNEFIFDIFEGKPLGRFMSYDPATKLTKVLVSNLYFANGVVVSPTQDFVIFCETPLRRCRKYYITGDRKGSIENFIDKLPGTPDNIRYDGNGLYWIGFSTEITKSWYLALKYPVIRKILAMMEKRKYLGRLKMEKNGGAVAVNLEGKLIAHYYDYELSMITTGIKIGNYLYCGSLGFSDIIRLDLDHFPARAAGCRRSESEL